MWWHGYIPQCSGSEAVTMLAWDTNTLPPISVHLAVSQYLNSPYRLIYNECNLLEQCHTDPVVAADYLLDNIVPQVQQVGLGERLIVGGATGDVCGRDWMSEFARHINYRGRPVEIIGWHWHIYPGLKTIDWRTGLPCLVAPSFQEQSSAIYDWWLQYGQTNDELWLSEFGLLNEQDSDVVARWLEDSLLYLDTQGLFWTRYYLWTDYDPTRPSIFDSEYNLTVIGQIYQAHQPIAPIQPTIYHTLLPIIKSR